MDDSDFSEFVKSLIDAVRDRKCIYDKKHVSYFNKFERERAWCDIALQLGQSVDDCQKRWKLLREKLAKELKKRDRSLALGEEFHSDWNCFKNIVFIEDHIAPRKRLEKYPYYCALNDITDKQLPTLSDSNLSNGSQQQPQQEQQNHQQFQQQQDYQSLLNYKPTRKRFRRLQQHNNEQLSNGNASESEDIAPTHLKEEPNVMVEIDEVTQDEQDMYEMDMLAKHELKELPDKSRSTRGIVDAALSNGSAQPTACERIKVKRLDLEPVARMENRNTQTLPCLEAPRFAVDVSDSDALFGQMVTAMLKDIPVEESKDDVKLLIMQMLIKAKRAHYTN